MIVLQVLLQIIGTIIFWELALWLRARRDDQWDDTNFFNWLRLRAHTILHPSDFGRMFYLTEQDLAVFPPERRANLVRNNRPFWYISRDEFREVVITRPQGS